MIFCLEIDNEYIIPEERIDNLKYIEERINSAIPEDKGSLRSILSYLYLHNGPFNVVKKRYLLSLKYLEKKRRNYY